MEEYTKLKTDLGVRPTYLDFYLKANADSRTIRQEFGSFPGLLAYVGELNDTEMDAFKENKRCLKK